jgi:hypothetical protein
MEALKLCRVMNSKIQEVDRWKEVAYGLSITDRVFNYHLCGRDCLEINEEHLMFIGASIFKKKSMSVPIVYFFKEDFSTEDIVYDENKKNLNFQDR